MAIFTDQRIIINVGHGLVDWSHRELANVQLNPEGVYLLHHGEDAHIVDAGPTANPWLYVLLSYVGLGISDPPL